MRIKLFGNLQISFEGRPLTALNTSRLQSLASYLILHGEGAQPREHLAFLFWPASSESQARTNLRQLIHNLKRALPPACDLLEITHFAVRWRIGENCTVDAAEFQKAVQNAARARADSNLAGELQSLTTAAQIYEDDLLPALYDDWLMPIREEYRQRLCDVLQRLAALCEGRAQFESAIPLAERLVALDPFSESHYQLLIRLYVANRDRASAIRAYHRCQRALRREMGVNPGPATVELFERLLRTSPEREAATGQPPGPVMAKTGVRLEKARALIGRTEEWKGLASAWDYAAAGGTRVVVISGEPGIGKTRLADELYQTCLRQGHAAVRSRCFAGAGQVSYAPVAECLRSDPIRAGWVSLTTAQVGELARLVPEIREQCGAKIPAGAAEPSPLAESWQRLRFYESISAAIAKARKPLLLYLDDLQWCDAESFECLSMLLTWPGLARVLVLGTVRAEETGREHPFTMFISTLRQFGMVVEIPLEPLDAERTAELARAESPSPLQANRLQEIFRTTRGNPLFVLETIRAGIESAQVHAVIAARLGQLSPASCELAGTASVIGRPFSFELLQKATDWDEASVSQALDELWRRRIIESRGAAEYDFTHDRLREVTCGELSLVRRRYLHRRVARALGEVYGSDIESWNGQIASHFEQAGMAEEAIAYYERAAAYARQRYADTEAADLLRRALAQCRQFSESDRRLMQELHLLATLGPALVATEGYSAAEVGATYNRALELSRRFQNQHIFAILSGAWVFHEVRGDLEKARQFSLDFLEAGRQDPAPGLRMAGDFLLGTSLFHLGRLEESLERLTLANAAHDDSGRSVLTLFAGPDLGVFCRAYLAHIAWHRGDEKRAVLYASEAVAAANRIRDPFSQAIALSYVALLNAFRGESGPALERGREALAVCSRYGFTYYLAMANIVTGWAAAAEGDVEPGLGQVRQGLEALRGLDAELRLPYYFGLLAETLGRAGRQSEALASLSNGFAFAAKNGEQWPIADLHRIQGELLTAQGSAMAARESFQRGLEAARRSGSLGFERKLLVLMGRTVASTSTERS